MNQTVLNITDFQPMEANSMQLIDSKQFNIKKLFQHSLQNNEDQDFYVITPNPEKYFNKIKSKLFLIKAAGGLVQNKNKDYLFIHRLGKWDLPKGKLDPDEKTKVAAIREVEEECGIHVKDKTDKLTTTYHVYMYKGKLTLKKTTWYTMKTVGNPKLTPQLEEDITEAIWVPRDQLKSIRANTYRMIDSIICDFILIS